MTKCFPANYIPSTELQPWIIIIPVVALLVALIFGICISNRKRIWLFWRTWKKTRVISNIEEHGVFILSNDYEKNKDNSSKINSYKDINQQATLLSYDTNREIPKSLFSITEHIGCGNFGNVCKGELKGLYGPNSVTTVAIKSIDGPADGAEQRDFLQEIKIMSYIKPHPYLVSMIGSCCSDQDDTREMWLIIEYCPHCDLKNYLIENKQQLLSENTKNPINNRCF